MSASAPAKCSCEICKNNRDFDISEQLLEAFKTGDIVIFAGSGVSTEGKMVLPHTFYEEISNELGISPSDGQPFPSIMSKFCSMPNGRQKLLLKLKERLNYIRSFEELYRTATSFHRELSTIHHVTNITTTNWDDYFEAKCGATPYVSAEDFALWTLPGRKVFKIHGSINSLGSIVATTEDYEKCYEVLYRGLIGSQLKTLLATKTIVYIGYSFSDFDFIKIHEILTSEMKGMRPHSYIVTLDEEVTGKFEELSMTPIRTAGTHFLARIKEHLVRGGELMPDSAFEGLGLIHDVVVESHSAIGKIDITKNPTAILTACYQDGLLHALERINSQKYTGEYSCMSNIPNLLRAYAEIRTERLHAKKLTDVAYVDGYMNGLLLVMASDEERFAVPIFYAYGYKEHPNNMRQYRKYLKEAPHYHKTAFKWCEKLLKRDGRFVRGIAFHHPPTLL